MKKTQQEITSQHCQPDSSSYNPVLTNSAVQTVPCAPAHEDSAIPQNPALPASDDSTATHVCYGQTAEWMKTPLGTEVDLGPGHIVLDGDPAPPRPAKCHGVKNQAHWYAAFIIIKQSLLVLSVQNTVAVRHTSRIARISGFPK